MLSAEGMSTAAIAPIVGASVSTVKNDAQQVANSGHVGTDPQLDRDPIITGHDGETYLMLARYADTHDRLDTSNCLCCCWNWQSCLRIPCGRPRAGSGEKHEAACGFDRDARGRRQTKRYCPHQTGGRTVLEEDAATRDSEGGRWHRRNHY